MFPLLSSDDFSWGNTRVIVGKGADKVTIDEKFDDSDFDEVLQQRCVVPTWWRILIDIRMLVFRI